jgi:hypothetical protein
VANSGIPGSQPPGIGLYGSGGAGFGSTVATASQPSAPSLSVGDAIVFVVASALLGAVLSVPAALVWNKIADPPQAPLTKQGAFLGEVGLNQQAEVTLWFLVVGLAFGLVAGLVVGWFGQRRGSVTVVAVVVLCAVATALTAYLGISVFGPDAKAQAAHAAIGSLITSNLSIGSKLVYLGWPIGGMVGACVAIFMWPERQNDPA